MIDFRDYYKLPFVLDGYSDSFVRDSENHRVFDFALSPLFRNSVIIPKASKEKIVENINTPLNFKYRYIKVYKYWYKDGMIFADDGETSSLMLVLRGWGYLTGIGGGLGLSDEKAVEIQDSLGKYIVEVLNN